VGDRKDAHAVRAAGRLLYMISPEIHRFDLPTMRRRWQDFKAWGVDGVCTDFSRGSECVL